MRCGKELVLLSSKNLVDAFRGEDWQAVKSAIQGIESADVWREVLYELCLLSYVHDSIQEGFHTEWTIRGHRIREQAADDALLLKALHVLLPTYRGSELTLFRGESASRYNGCAMGFAWTTSEDTARMFARGLNAMHAGGGVLLSTHAPSEAIIAGPSKHSAYLQENEYVVDWRALRQIDLVDSFPCIA